MHGVMRFADGKRERRLSDDEYKALGDALRKAEDGQHLASGNGGCAVSRAHRLAHVARRWGCDGMKSTLPGAPRRLATPKPGGSIRPLSHAACDVLRSLTRSGDLVFPATRGNGDVIMSGFKKMWKKIAKLGNLPADVTPHTLRHSFASLAGDLGYSEPTIAALVGHKGRTITVALYPRAPTLCCSPLPTRWQIARRS